MENKDFYKLLMNNDKIQLKGEYQMGSRFTSRLYFFESFWVRENHLQGQQKTICYVDTAKRTI